MALSAAPVGQFHRAQDFLQLAEPRAGLVGTDLRLRLAGRVPDPAQLQVWVRLYAVAPDSAAGLVTDPQALRALLDGQEPAAWFLVPLVERQFDWYVV